MLSSLFTNLDNYKNADLKQGRVFKQYEQEVKTYTFERLPFLELTSMPGLTSINEAFNGDDSIFAKNKHVKDNLSQSEADFNKTLSEYSSLQQNLASSALYHKTDPSVNQKIMAQISKLNDKLMQQAKNISTEMETIHVDDDSVRKYIKVKQATLDNYISKLADQRSDMETVDGMGENTRLIRTSNQYHYLMWFIVLITFISLFSYILTSELVMDTLLVVICLMVIYLLARAVNNNYM
jgi:hypothetical protein